MTTIPGIPTLTSEEQAQNQTVIWHGTFLSWLDAHRNEIEAEAALLRTRVTGLVPVAISACSLIAPDIPGADLRGADQGALAVAVNYARHASRLASLEADLRLLDSYLPLARRGYRIEDITGEIGWGDCAALICLWEMFWADCTKARAKADAKARAKARTKADTAD